MNAHFSHRRPSILFSLAFALWLVSCSDGTPGTGLLLHVSFDSTLMLDQLRVAVEAAGVESPEAALVPGTAEPLTSERSVLVKLPRAWGDRRAEVLVQGLAQGELKGQGQEAVTLVADRIVTVDITLQPICAASCSEGQARCVVDQLQRCEQDEWACLVWGVPEDCPADRPFCSNGLCEAECSDECDEEAAQRCSGQGAYQVCGQHDSDSCLDWGQDISCGAEELCQDGQCVASCDGGPCACSEGETQPCADVGQCSEGERPCVEGSFGACRWTVGPEPEVCDGKDNDCDGSVDEDLDCCQPDCAGKACGADNGCGQPCSTGDCPGNETCNAQGQCVPGSSCTSEGPLALDSTGYVGRDSSLGIDANGKVHISYYDDNTSDLKYATNASGTWVYQTLDSAGNLGSHTSLGIDPGGNIHISYYDHANSDLKYSTNASGTWVYQTLDSAGVVGEFTSLGLDSAGKVHISYRDHTNNQLKYATNASGTWVSQTLDSAGFADTTLGVDAGGKVHIGYRDYQNYDLKYATNASGSWVYQTLDPAGDVSNYMSLGIDANGKVHISCHDTTTSDLKYATNASGTWVYQTLDSADKVGQFNSLGIDANGKVHISYYDFTNHDLKYATNASGAWVYQTLDSTDHVGWDSSLGIDANGKVHISYHDTTNNDLKYVSICP